MKGQRDCIVHRLVFTVSKLEGIKLAVSKDFEVLQDQALKNLHHHRLEGHRSVVNQAGDPGLFRCWDDGRFLFTFCMK